ncbi:MAG: preprotein translocase subunit SecG [Kiritimatiellae bacterium]|nr:preprotein translocase subunit SecG [Kiritimatiellia bacterium]
MSILIGFLYVVEVLVCLLLVLVVMLQKPKEGGLGGAIGGGMLEASLGADAGNVLIKTTAVLGAIFLLNTLVLARLTSTVHSHSLMAQESEPVATESAPPALPMAPELPAAPAPAPAAPAPAAPAPAPAPAAPAPAPAAPAPAPAPAAPAPAPAPAAPAK